MFFGRSDKARERRAAKVRATYADFPGMTPELLEVLARTADAPSKEQVSLYVQALPAGATPRRGLHGLKLSEATFYACLLFDDGLSLRWGARERMRDKELTVQGAELPFWGLQAVEVFSRDGNDGVLVSGNSGETEYRLGFLGFDPKDVQEFAEEIRTARARYAERSRPAAPAVPAPAAQPEPEPAISIDSALPPEQQLAALEQMRMVGAIPEDVYRATAAKIRAAGR